VKQGHGLSNKHQWYIVRKRKGIHKGEKQGDVKENGKKEKMVLGWARVVNQQHA
jgi:hypothetical protein